MTTTENSRADALTGPYTTRHTNIGDWLWCELMDYCRERGMPPASNGRLFSLVDRARAAWDSQPAPSPADERAALPQIPDLVKATAWLTVCLRTELSRFDDNTHKALDEVEAQLSCVRAITNGAIDYEAVMPRTAVTRAEVTSVQWWLAELDQHGNPKLSDGAHSERAGADKAMYLIKNLGLDNKGKRWAVARVELSEPQPSADGVNHDAVSACRAMVDAARTGASS